MFGIYGMIAAFIILRVIVVGSVSKGPGVRVDSTVIWNFSPRKLPPTQQTVNSPCVRSSHSSL